MQTLSDSQAVFSWGRYLYWSDLKRRDWEKLMRRKGGAGKASNPEWLGLTCYWAASLYVVIEGWDRAKFNDPIVDALLGKPNYRAVLKRLRNGTFHFQPEILSQKFIEFFESPDELNWLFFLHEEFCRWLRDWVDTVERSALFSEEQVQEWHENISHLIGWLPLRPAEKELKALSKELDETERVLDASGSTSEAAEALRASLGSYDTAVKNTAESVREYRRTQLAKLGLNPDSYLP
jgi:hypothetical protein